MSTLRYVALLAVLSFGSGCKILGSSTTGFAPVTVDVPSTPSPVSASASTVAAAPTSIAGDGTATSTITVTLKDANNTVVQGKTVSLSSNRGGGTDTIAALSATTDVNGQASFTVKSSTSGNAVLTATDTTDTVTLTQTATVTFTAVGAVVDANVSTVIASSAAVTNDGVATVTLTVTVLDSAAAPVPGKTVSIASSRGANDTIAPASAVTNGSGVATFTASSAVGGASTFIATADSVTLARTQSVSFRSSALSGLNLMVPIEMIDLGVGSLTTTVTFNRSSTTLDTNAYNGTVSYYFEVVAANSETSLSRGVDLIGPSGTVKATLSIPASSPQTLYRIGTPWTPDTATGTYKIRLAGTTSGGNLIVSAARILVKQVGATSTRIHIPLTTTNSNSTGSDASGLTGTVPGGTTNYSTFGSAGHSCFWKKYGANFSGLAAGNAWTLETYASATGGELLLKLAVMSSTGSVVTASEISHNNTATLRSVNFADGATNFTNGTTFTMAGLVGPTTTAGKVFKAGLWVRLDNLYMTEVYHRVSESNASVGGTAVANGAQRTWIDSTLFSSPTFYFDTAAKLGLNGTGTIDLMDNGATDTGTAGSSVSTLNFTSLAPASLRSASFVPAANSRYTPQFQGGSQSITPYCSFIVAVPQ